MGCFRNFKPVARGGVVENPLTVSLWAGVVLYAAIGLFGVVIFRDAAPIAQDLSGGYGIAYSTIAASETGK